MSKYATFKYSKISWATNVNIVPRKKYFGISRLGTNQRYSIQGEAFPEMPIINPD